MKRINVTEPIRSATSLHQFDGLARAPACTRQQQQRFEKRIQRAMVSRPAGIVETTEDAVETRSVAKQQLDGRNGILCYCACRFNAVCHHAHIDRDLAAVQRKTIGLLGGAMPLHNGRRYSIESEKHCRIAVDHRQLCFGKVATQTCRAFAETTDRCVDEPTPIEHGAAHCKCMLHRWHAYIDMIAFGSVRHRRAAQQRSCTAVHCESQRVEQLHTFATACHRCKQTVAAISATIADQCQQWRLIAEQPRHMRNALGAFVGLNFLPELVVFGVKHCAVLLACRRRIDENVVEELGAVKRLFVFVERVCETAPLVLPPVLDRRLSVCLSLLLFSWCQQTRNGHDHCIKRSLKHIVSACVLCRHTNHCRDGIRVTAVRQCVACRAKRFMQRVAVEQRVFECRPEMQWHATFQHRQQCVAIVEIGEKRFIVADRCNLLAPHKVDNNIVRAGKVVVGDVVGLQNALHYFVLPTRFRGAFSGIIRVSRTSRFCCRRFSASRCTAAKLSLPSVSSIISYSCFTPIVVGR